MPDTRTVTLDHDGVWNQLNALNEQGEVPELSGHDADGRPVWLWLNEHGGDEVYMYAARLEIEDGAVTSKAVEIDPDEDMRYPLTILSAPLADDDAAENDVDAARAAAIGRLMSICPGDTPEERFNHAEWIVGGLLDLVQATRDIPPDVGDSERGEQRG